MTFAVVVLVCFSTTWCNGAVHLSSKRCVCKLNGYKNKLIVDKNKLVIDEQDFEVRLAP